MGAPHGDKLDRINPFSNSSYNCNFNSFSSSGAILYGVMDASVASGTTSIGNSISLYGGNPGNSFGNTSRKSLTVGISDTLGLAFTVSIT